MNTNIPSVIDTSAIHALKALHPSLTNEQVALLYLTNLKARAMPPPSTLQILSWIPWWFYTNTVVRLFQPDKYQVYALVDAIVDPIVDRQYKTIE